MLIGYTGDVHQFRSQGHYATYNGTAPIDVSSGGRVVQRLFRRGNRGIAGPRGHPGTTLPSSVTGPTP
jgi:transposase